jgi:SAM-dependent methyltransferase
MADDAMKQSAGGTNQYDSYWSQPNPPPVADRDASTRRRLFWEAIGTSSGYSRLLDCGSGEGYLVSDACSRGLEAVGLEVSSVAINRARKLHPGCTFLQHSVEEQPWPVPGESFDLAASFEVIEHLMEPRRLLEGLQRSLRPGAYLGLTTPYHGLLKNLAIALHGFERHFNVEGEHIRFFTDSALKTLLRQTGFETERLVHFGRVPALWTGVFVWARKS